MDPITFDDEEELEQKAAVSTEPDSSLFTLPEGSFTEELEEAPVEAPQEETIFTLPEGSWEEEASAEEAATVVVEGTPEDVYTLPEGTWEEEAPEQPSEEEEKGWFSSVVGAAPAVISSLKDVSPALYPAGKFMEEMQKRQDEVASQELGITEERGQTFSKESILSDPSRMSVIKDYMVLRNGHQYTDKPDEEVYDDYITTMRWVGSNDLSLVTDIRLLGQAEEEDKAKLGKAYLLFQAIEGPDSLGEFGTAVADYTEGTLSSISTWAGLGIGKILSRTGSKSAARVAINVAKDAAIQSAIKSGATKTAAKAAGAQAARQVATTAAKAMGTKTAIATVGVDAGLNVAVDAMYQDHMIDSGAQDEYSFAQGAFSAAAAVIPATVGGAWTYSSWKQGAPALGATIEAGNAAAKAAKRAFLTPAKVQTAFKVFNADLVDWQKAIARGTKINLDSKAAQDKIYESLVGTSDKGLGLLPTLMKGAGVVFSKEAPAIQEMISFYRSIDTQTRWTINQQMKKDLGMSMGQLTDILAKSVNKSATQVGYLSKVAQEVQQVAVASKAANKLVKKVGNEGIGDVTLRGIQYFQSMWRRSLVSHPATSAVNLMGWGSVKAAESLSFLLSGVSHGTLGLAGMAASPVSATAKSFSNQELKKAVATFQAVGFNLRTLLDPYATREAFDQILPHLPKESRQQLSSGGFSGVESTALNTGKKGVKGKGAKFKEDTIYGFDPKNPFIAKTERFLDRAATVTLVKTQDSYSKSISFLSNLDYQLRLNGGKGVMETLSKGGVEAIPQEVMENATKRTMRDVMSLDYTKGSNAMHKMAGMVENLSNTPGLGMVFPFGRFLNNSLAFSFRYSPVGLLRVFSQDTIDDLPTIFAQAAVGSTFMYQMVKHEGEKYERGIPWNIEEGEDGQQYDLTNMAPSSAYHLMGRLWYHHTQGETDFSQDSVKDLFTQLGSLSLVYTADRNTELLTKSFQDFTNKLADTSEGGEGQTMKAILSAIMAAGDGVLAGFTRPLESANVGIGTALGTDQISDRGLYEGTDLYVSEATKYVDQLFALVNPSDGLGVSESELAPPKVSATQPMAHKELNPWARMAGLRIRQPQTASERLFAESDFPEWRANTKTDIPELDRVINERVFNYLERKSEEVLKSPRWKNANLEARRALVRDILKASQKDVRDWIDSSPGSFEHLLQARRELTTKSERLRNDAKKELGISDVPDRKLSYRQIEQMRALIDLYEDGEKAFVE